LWHQTPIGGEVLRWVGASTRAAVRSAQTRGPAAACTTLSLHNSLCATTHCKHTRTSSVYSKPHHTRQNASHSTLLCFNESASSAARRQSTLLKTTQLSTHGMHVCAVCSCLVCVSSSCVLVRQRTRIFGQQVQTTPMPQRQQAQQPSTHARPIWTEGGRQSYCRHQTTTSCMMRAVRHDRHATTGHRPDPPSSRLMMKQLQFRSSAH
jgi:hypothetical protein